MNPNLPLSRLPPEIREQIWLLTFSPRTINLHIHTQSKSIIKRGRPPARPRTYLSGPPTKLTDLSFTATTTTTPSLPDPSLIPHSEQEALHPGTAASPPGPIALSVCSESRAPALRHYTLSFPGRNLIRKPKHKWDKIAVVAASEWETSGFWEKKIWVDFAHDEVVMFLAYYCKDEAMRIERLGIRGFEEGVGGGVGEV